MSNSNIISEWYKSSAETEKYIAKLNDFNSQKYLDVRLYYLDGEAWKPTKKGITVSIYHLDELKDAIEKAEESISGGTRSDDSSF